MVKQPALTGIDLASLGFPTSFVKSIFWDAQPAFQPSGYQSLAPATSDLIHRFDDTYTIKTGAEFRFIPIGEAERAARGLQLQSRVHGRESAWGVHILGIEHRFIPARIPIFRPDRLQSRDFGVLSLFRDLCTGRLADQPNADFFVGSASAFRSASNSIANVM